MLTLKSWLFFLVIALFFWGQQGMAASATERLEAKLNAVKTMTASFSEVVYAKKRALSRSSGTMALWRPGRFRWQTKSPMEQLVLADGEHLWVYDIDLEQVTVKKQDKGMGGTAALFLSGYDEHVARDFDVILTSHGNKDQFDLHSKSSKASIHRVILTFIGQDLSAIQLFDQLGQRTDVTLTNIKNNPTLQLALFKFKTPKGVDVVQQ